MSEPAKPIGVPPRLDDLRIHRDEERPGRRIWLWVVLALLVVGAIAGFVLRPRPPVVRVATAAQAGGTNAGPATVLNATGYVTARRQATVSSKVTGKITEGLVEEGTRVEEGQLLAKIDPAPPDAALRLAQSQVDAAASMLEETKVRIEKARLDLGRQQQLQSNGVNAQADLDAARADLKALEARLHAQQ